MENKIQQQFVIRSLSKLGIGQNLLAVGAQRAVSRGWGARGPANAPALRACPWGQLLLDTGRGAAAHPSLDLASRFPSPLQSTASTSRLNLPLGMGVPAFGLGNRINRPCLVAEKPARRRFVQHLSRAKPGHTRLGAPGGRESTDTFCVSGNQWMMQSGCSTHVCWQSAGSLAPRQGSLSASELGRLRPRQTGP